MDHPIEQMPTVEVVAVQANSKKALPATTVDSPTPLLGTGLRRCRFSYAVVSPSEAPSRACPLSLSSYSINTQAFEHYCLAAVKRTAQIKL